MITRPFRTRLVALFLCGREGRSVGGSGCGTFGGFCQRLAGNGACVLRVGDFQRGFLPALPFGIQTHVCEITHGVSAVKPPHRLYPRCFMIPLFLAGIGKPRQCWAASWALVISPEERWPCIGASVWRTTGAIAFPIPRCSSFACSPSIPAVLPGAPKVRKL